jgi:SAM-dependent methyltransferase
MEFEQVNLEAVKKYWNDRPCNIRHSNKEIGTKEYFEDVEKRRYMVEPHIIEFADFSNCRGKKVLEIGCGIGTDSVSFLKNNNRGKNKGKITIDSEWKEYMYDIAFQKYVVQKSNPNKTVIAYIVLADKTKAATIDGLNQIFKIKRDIWRKINFFCIN